MNIDKFFFILIFLLVLSSRRSSIFCLDVILSNSSVRHFYTQPFIGNKQTLDEINNKSIITFISILGSTSKELQSCDKAPPNAIINNSIIIVAPFGGCSIERHVQLVEENGALAVIVATTQAWKTCNTVDLNKFNNTIPAICMSSSDITELIKIIVENANQSRATIGRFTCQENEYATGLNHVWINIFTISLFVIYIVIAILGVIKFLQYFKTTTTTTTTRGGKQNKLLLKIIFAILIYCAITSAITVIDLNGYRRWYNTMQFYTTYYFFFSTSGMYLFMIFFAYVTDVLSEILNERRELIRIINYSITGVLITFYSVPNLIVFPIFGYSWNYTQQLGNEITDINCIITGIYSICYFFSVCFLISRMMRFSALGHNDRHVHTKRRYFIFSIQLLISFFCIFFTFILLILLTFSFITEPINVYFNIYFLINCISVIWLILLLCVFKSETRMNSSNNSNVNKSDINNNRKGFTTLTDTANNNDNVSNNNNNSGSSSSTNMKNFIDGN